ncbi:phthalate transporter [Paramyrothecium foliicola]|nr:phthalate transporter [Paramyrothecium foliicola]
MAAGNSSPPPELEKQNEFSHVDHPSLTGTDNEVDHSHGFSEAEQKAIIRRTDRRLVVICGAMYCVSLMDRTNMSAANIAGMSAELLLTGLKYNIANLLFFIPYIIFQPPSTILVRAIGPRIHLAGITFAWGAVMIGMGFVKNFGQLAGMRVMLGFLEAGFFPSCVYLLSTWYTRYEVGKRYSVFYLLGCVASAFSGILAFGLMQLNGREGLTGWRWIFIIEGVITCALATAGYWLLVDFPDSKRESWKFLGPRERAWVVDRIRRDRGDAEVPPFNLGKFMRAGLDWKIWAYALVFFCSTTITYALAYTLPILLVFNMGFDIGPAQCLVAPPFAFAGIVMFCTAWVGDKYRMRGPIIIFNMTLCVIGLPIMGWASSTGVRYFGVFLVTAGANSNIPASMAFQANNIRGQWKRAFCSATLVGFGGIGGIAGSLVFRSQDSPNYHPGMWACIACALLAIVLVVILDLTFKRENAKADRGEKVLEAHDEDSPTNFRYTL